MAILAKGRKPSGEEVSLRRHTEDVVSWARKLYELQGEPLIATVDEERRLEEALTLSAALHDLGKVHPYFQLVRLKNQRYEPFYPYHEIPHSLFSLFFINERKLRERLGDKWKNFVLRSVAFHHWRERFKDYIFKISDELKHFAHGEGRDKLETLLSNLEAELGELSLDGKNLGGFLGINEKLLDIIRSDIPLKDYVYPNYLSYLLPKHLEIEEEEKKKWIVLHGLLMRADHVASYEEEIGQQVSIEELKPEQYDNLKAKVEGELRKKVGADVDLWQDRELQGRLGESLVLLAPTGYGKTEFAFLWASGSRMIYTLPIRAAVNQIFKRAKRIFGEDKVGLLHSDADVFLYHELERSSDAEEPYSVRAYDLSRLFLLPEIISTGDQFFPYALRPPGYERVFSLMPGVKLVVDEIQGYDPVAMAVIVKYVEFVHRMGGKFLIMTATLPSFVKEELNNRLSIDISNNTIELFKKMKAEFERTKKHYIELEKVEVEKRKDKEQLHSRMIKAIRDKVEVELKRRERILVIVNTVDLAQRLFDTLREMFRGEPVKVKLLHSRFSLKDREQHEEELRNLLPNRGNKRTAEEQPEEKVILIATQVVEASLDIDADVLITELAPLDALIQRMGRVVRGVRPGEEYEAGEPNVFVLIPVMREDNDGKSKGRRGRKKRKSEEEGCEERKYLDSLVNGGVYYEVQMRASWESLQSLKGKPISEVDKSEALSNYYYLLERYYKGEIPCYDERKAKDYLAKFYEILNILDAGYMSNERSEAHKVFRNILNVNVIPNTMFDDFLNDLEEYIERGEVGWSSFKREVLSKYVVSLPVFHFMRYDRLALKPVDVKVEVSISGDLPSELISRVKRYLRGIFLAEDSVVKVEYDRDRGVTYDRVSRDVYEGVSNDIL